MKFNFAKKKWLLRLTVTFALVLTLIIIGGSAWVFKLDREMLSKMEQKKLVQPTVFYAQAPTWALGSILPLTDVISSLNQQFRPRQKDQRLFPGDFILLKGVECASFVLAPTTTTPLEEQSPTASVINNPELQADDQCLRIYWDKSEHHSFKDPWVVTVLLNSSLQIKGVYKGEDKDHLESLTEFIMKPQIIAQYWGEDPILREQKSLREFPVACLNAIIAIEDAKFLEHKGVSWVGILRASAVNLVSGRKAQGGSTLTQQLIKNYLLTPEKTLKRKALEFVMALLVEAHFDKDLILETYLNIIYMGQQGPYQVRGYGAASRYYFQKEVSELSLGQCSLLAAIVNSPGQYNPFTQMEKSKARRSLVLEKMRDQNFITEEEKVAAAQEPLPKNENPDLYSTLPYFLQAVTAQAKKLGFEDLMGMKIYTTMDMRLQEAAQTSIATNVNKLETENNTIKKAKAKKNIELESSLVSVDIGTGSVRAVVGGKSFRKTQFNRILSSKRQVGSTFKPMVYLTALNKALVSGNKNYSPIYELRDEPFIYRFDKQKWAPENYDRKYFGPIPMYFALKESLNLATAQLALDVGLESIIETARALGVQSELRPVPSLCLGAFELSPLELLQAYLTIARLGKHIDYTFIDYLENGDGVILWEARTREVDQKISSIATQQLIGMLKQTILSGTAKRVSLSGFNKVTAGKTGTTNDYKDSWFVGFTPEKLTIVWTGFDDNTPSGLTGASGSLPAWLSFMEEATKYDPTHDFPWTDEVKIEKIPALFFKANPKEKQMVKVDRDQLMDADSKSGISSSSEVELILKKD